MNADELKIMQTSKDGKQLQQTAVGLARSGVAEDHAQLLKFLRTEEFLLRLDTEAAYQVATSNRLRISRVLEAVGKNPAATSQRILVALTQDAVFLKEVERVDVLLVATTVLRPPAPEVVAFWDKYFQPEDATTPITVTVLVENGSAAALQLLEKKMADPKHLDGNKVAWMHTRILTHRNDVAVLESCERMLKGGLPENLRGDMVESLFDYRPQEWYKPANPYNAPSRQFATDAARVVLRRIGEWALEKAALDERQKLAVKVVLKEIGA